MGTDQDILSAVPHFKTGALVRIENMYRYDDGDYISTNLIDSYDRLMAFVAKHLPDKFYMEGDQRIMLRDKIFREIVSNLLVHREFMNGLPATFIIYKDRVETVNANNPHGSGPIDPENFAPFPKNPAIASFFMQIGRADELGSGVLNVNRLIHSYAKRGKADFIEGTAFKTVIYLDVPLKSQIKGVIDVGDMVDIPDRESGEGIDTVSDTVSDTVKQRLIELVKLVIQNPGRRSNFFAEKISIGQSNVRRDMQRIAELVEFIGPPRTGGYYITKYMKDRLEK